MKLNKKEKKAIRQAELAMLLATKVGSIPQQPLNAVSSLSSQMTIEELPVVMPTKVKGRAQATAEQEKRAVVAFWTNRCQELLKEKGDLTDDEKEYLSKVLSTMKDEKLKNIIAGLIGWGDDERAELETFCAIALEAMGRMKADEIKDAAKVVEMRYYVGDKTYHEPDESYYADGGVGAQELLATNINNAIKLIKYSDANKRGFIRDVLEAHINYAANIGCRVSESVSLVAALLNGDEAAIVASSQQLMAELSEQDNIARLSTDVIDIILAMTSDSMSSVQEVRALLVAISKTRG